MCLGIWMAWKEWGEKLLESVDMGRHDEIMKVYDLRFSKSMDSIGAALG